MGAPPTRCALRAQDQWRSERSVSLLNVAVKLTVATVLTAAERRVQGLELRIVGQSFRASGERLGARLESDAFGEQVNDHCVRLNTNASFDQNG